MVRVLCAVFLLLTAGCGNPFWRFDNIPVTGEIHADGTCTVAVARETLMAPAKARLQGTPMEARIGAGTLLILSCVESRDTTGGVRYMSGTFLLTLSTRTESPAGDYELSWGGGDPDQPGTAGAAFYHHRWADDGWSGAGAYLRAMSGTLSLRQTPNGFTAVFSFRARRKSRFG